MSAGFMQASARGVCAAIGRMGPNLAAWIVTLARAPRIPAVRWNPLWPLTGRVVIGAVICIVIVAVTMVLLDAWLISQARRVPAWVLRIFRVLTDLGLSGWFLWPLGILLLLNAALFSPALPRISRSIMGALVVRLGFLFIAIALPGLFASLVKRLVGRARPFLSVDDPYVYDPFTWQSAYASLPSGHATTSFAAAVAFGALWPHLRPLMWTYAVAVAVSRVIVGVHHPSDVIAGAIVGTLGALLVRSWFAARRLGFSVDSSGSVRALPGPSWRRIKRLAASPFAQ